MLRQLEADHGEATVLSVIEQPPARSEVSSNHAQLFGCAKSFVCSQIIKVFRQVVDWIGTVVLLSK
jgi:hypothetical protein